MVVPFESTHHGNDHLSLSQGILSPDGGKMVVWCLLNEQTMGRTISQGIPLCKSFLDLGK
jgi:hypothetical protein